MAKAVLEREGYTTSVDEWSDRQNVVVDVHETGWQASGPAGASTGSDFASLAAFLRRRTAA
jgi:hypothetical protein